MADDTPPSSFPDRGEGGGRGSRPQGNREPGGFRIRLSDNEMQAARALQEAFGLRSTVAVLGFSLRTLAQQLEEGQLEDLIARHRAQAGSRGPGPRREDRRRERPEGGGGGRGPRVDPFARPSRPAAAPAAEAEPEEEFEPGTPVVPETDEAAPAPEAPEAPEEVAAEAATAEEA